MPESSVWLLLLLLPLMLLLFLLLSLLYWCYYSPEKGSDFGVSHCVLSLHMPESGVISANGRKLSDIIVTITLIWILLKSYFLRPSKGRKSHGAQSNERVGAQEKEVMLGGGSAQGRGGDAVKWGSWGSICHTVGLRQLPQNLFSASVSLRQVKNISMAYSWNVLLQNWPLALV